MRAIQEMGMIGKAIDAARPTKRIEKMPLALRSGQRQQPVCATELRRVQPRSKSLPMPMRDQSAALKSL